MFRLDHAISKEQGRHGLAASGGTAKRDLETSLTSFRFFEFHKILLFRFWEGGAPKNHYTYNGDIFASFFHLSKNFFSNEWNPQPAGVLPA